MAAGAFIRYNAANLTNLSGLVDLDSDTFGVALLTTTHVPALTDTVFTDLDNELSHGSYTGGSNNGLAAATPAITNITGAQYKWTTAAITFTPAGTDASFRYAVFFERNVTAGSANLLGYVDLNTSAANITVTAGNTFTLNVPTNGWFHWTNV